MSLTILSLSLSALLLPTGVRAQETWAIDRMVARDIAPGTAETFRQVLRSRLAAGRAARFIDLNTGCADAVCARNAGFAAGATTVVFGSLGRLGTKVVATASAVDVRSGGLVGSESFGVDREEELDLAAARLAQALLSGGPVEPTVQLGPAPEPAEPPRRRDTRLGVSLAVEGIFPVRGFADGAKGMGAGVGLWFEAMDIAIEPRIGFRTELGAGERDWDHVPFEISAAWLALRNDITPLIGGGVGLHYLHEETPVSREVGSVLVSRTTDVIEDSEFGFCLFGRAGVLLLRSYDVSLLVALDYAITFADFVERENEQALRLQVEMIIGGN